MKEVYEGHNARTPLANAYIEFLNEIGPRYKEMMAQMKAYSILTKEWALICGNIHLFR